MHLSFRDLKLQQECQVQEADLPSHCLSSMQQQLLTSRIRLPLQRITPGPCSGAASHLLSLLPPCSRQHSPTRSQGYLLQPAPLLIPPSMPASGGDIASCTVHCLLPATQLWLWRKQQSLCNGMAAWTMGGTGQTCPDQPLQKVLILRSALAALCSRMPCIIASSLHCLDHNGIILTGASH